MNERALVTAAPGERVTVTGETGTWYVQHVHPSGYWARVRNLAGQTREADAERITVVPDEPAPNVPTSVPVVDRTTDRLEVGDVVGYTPAGCAGPVAATVETVHPLPGGMARVDLIVAGTGQRHEVWCTPATSWRVELPAVMAGIAVPRPVFGCQYADGYDGCCGHPDAATPECFLGAPIAGPGEWSDCPLVSETAVPWEPAP